MMKHVVVATCHCLVRPVIFCVHFTYAGKETGTFLNMPVIWISKKIAYKNALIVSNSESCTTWDTANATCWKQALFSSYSLDGAVMIDTCPHGMMHQ